MLDTEYVQTNNLTINNVLDKVEKVDTEEIVFNAKKMYFQDDYVYPIYYIYGTLKESFNSKTSKDCYLIMYVDNSSTSVAIVPIDSGKYNEIISNKSKNITKQITRNNYNKLSLLNITNETIVMSLMTDYKTNVKEDYKKAYELLDEEYREKRFGNVEAYKNYLSENNSSIESAMASQYSVREESGYKQYICIDQNGNYYIINETAAMQYSVILDTYTLDLPEFIEKYNQTNEQGKTALNIQKFVDSLNSKDYQYAYGKLADGFKTNYFQTLSDFERYINNTLYEKNEVEYSGFNKDAGLCTYDISFINAENSVDDVINKTIIMKLEEGTDFVLSFNVE